MRYFHAPIGISLCAMLTACTSAPHVPPPPTVALPEMLAQGDGGALPSHWWHLYREPALDALVERALVNNRDLRVAAAHLQQARAALGEARAQGQPQAETALGGGYGSTLQDQIAARAGDPVRTGGRIDPSAALSWELDLSGRLRAGVRAARAEEGAQAALADGVRVAVAAGVTQAWLRACDAGQRLGLAREALALSRQQRDLAVQLRDVGAALPAEVADAQAQAAQAEAVIPLLEAARHNALVDLAVLIGETDLPAADCTRLPTVEAPVPLGDGMALLRRRPDLRAAERRLAEATAGIGVAVADLYPRLALGAGAAVSSPTVAGLAASDNAVWQLGPLLSWSLPNITAARARIAQARAGEAAALASFDAAILNAFREVNQAAQDEGATLRRQASLREAAAGSASVLFIARARRNAGAATAPELLTAMQGDVSARMALAQADADVAEAQLHLFRALGGGWEGAPPVSLPSPHPTAK